MINIKSKKKRKDAGFSLVEVLLAVCLLGLVAAPILQMLYSSYLMNQKSRKYLAASDLAQTLLEAISAQSWEGSARADQKTSVDGLEKFYCLDTSVNDQVLYKLPTGESAAAPKADRLPVVTDGKKKVVYFRDLTYNGYPFCGIIEFDISNKNDRYFTIPVKVVVYDADPDGNHIRNDADFSSSNKDGVEEIKTFSTSIINNFGITK